MHLMDILRYRPVPGSAVYLALTRRCPLTCRHCSTASLLNSEEHDAELFLGFARTFTAEDHPEVVLMSGGEALLRPRLVGEIARQARAVGTRSYLGSGMYFARSKRIPRPIREAISQVDHFAVSLDVFHEEQVPRGAVLAVLRELVEDGKDVSIQIVGMSDDDPYLADATAHVRDALGDRVPMLVGLVGATGRAADWLQVRRNLTHLPLSVLAQPCGVAAWPIVSFDGTVIACCNQHVVDLGRRAPAHLVLGHSSRDSWQTIRSRTRASAALRAVRTFGPRYVAQEIGVRVDDEQCTACYGLSAPEAERGIADLVARPAFPVLEEGVGRILQSGGPPAFARRYGSRRYAELVTLGYKSREQPCVA